MEQVAVLFVDENGAANDPGAIRGKSFLTEQTTPPTGLEGMSVWSKDNITPVALNGNDNFGVIIVASRSPARRPISLNGTINQICNQNPTQTHCYGGGTLTSGISFIHALHAAGHRQRRRPDRSATSRSAAAARTISRAPYFNLTGRLPDRNHGHDRLRARVEQRQGTRAEPSDGARRVRSGERFAGGHAPVHGHVAGSGSVWGNASSHPPETSGANQVNLSGSTDNNGGCNGNNGSGGNCSFNKVAKPYVADDTSGPVQYLTDRDVRAAGSRTRG